MKKTITTLTLAIITSVLTLASTPDSMYVHCTGTNGDSIVVFAIANVDSIVYYAPVLPTVPQGIDWNTATEGVAQANALTDADGNSYSAVKIGTQIWMAENLRATQYTDGTAILNVDDRTQNGSGANNTAWVDLGDNDTDKAYCWYNNDSTINAALFGALYTYAAAINGTPYDNINNVQGVCPAGWHLPSDAEWKTLEMALGMSQTNAENTGWRGTNEGSQLAGNSDLWNTGFLKYDSEFGTSGFLALPGGYRSSGSGAFFYKGDNCYWWSSTQYSSSSSYPRLLRSNNIAVNRANYSKSYGFSVRCVRD